jgi:hypothetical protein
MVLKNAKRILAVIVSGVMVAGASLTAFATDTTTANGDIIVEYDDSVEISFDTVTVPLIGQDTFDFTLDPTGLLHQFEPATYDAGTVYFTKENTAAKLEAANASTTDNTGHIFKKKYTKLATTDAAWTGAGGTTLVKTLDNDAIDEVNTGFCVWCPKAGSTYAGEFVEIDASNIGDWFELVNPQGTNPLAIQLKSGYKKNVGTTKTACSGDIYKIEYDDVSTGITDSDVDPISNYVTVDTSGVVTAVKNLYLGDAKSAATVTDVKYTDSETKQTGSSDNVFVQNLSTKVKTVSAKIKLTNVDGIEFVDDPTSDFDSTDTDPKMYIAAKDANGEVALAGQGDGTATATYTKDLTKASVTELLYAVGTNSVTGGNSYSRYEEYGTTYDNNSFYIVAQANTSTDAKEAWKEWAKQITASTKPAIEIVYSIKDKAAPYVSATTISSSSNAVTVTPPSGVTVSSIVLTKAAGGTVTLSSGTHYTVSGSTYTFDSGMLGNHATGKITFTFSDSKTEELTIQ